MIRRRQSSRLAATLTVLLLAHGAGAQLDWPARLTLPEAPPTDSLIAPGDEARRDALVRIGLAWLLPTNDHHRAWKRIIDARADEKVPDREPRDLDEAARFAAITKATAMRWVVDPVGPFSRTDLQQVITTLKNASPAPGPADQRAAVLLDLLIAYDLTRSARVDDDTRQTIARQLLRLATPDPANPPNDQPPHETVQIAATRALAGLVLHQPRLLADASAELHAALRAAATDDGVVMSGQSSPLNQMLPPLAHLITAHHTAGGDGLFASVAPLIDATLAMALPDGHLPNLGQGMVDASAIVLLSRGADATRRARLLWSLHHVLEPGRPAGMDPVDLFLLTDFSIQPTPPPDAARTSFSPGQAKLTVMRDHLRPTADWLMLSPGLGGKHADTGQLLLAARGEYLLVAPGVTDVDVPAFDPYAAASHNVLLIDRDNHLRGDEATHTHRLSSAQRTFDFASLLMRDGDVHWRRSVAHVDSGYYLVADTMRADGAHDYGFNLIGRGIFAPLDRADRRASVAWTGRRGQVIATLIATDDLRLETEQTWTRLDPTALTRADRLLATARGEAVAWLCVLETNQTDRRRRLIVEDASHERVAAVTVRNTMRRWTDTHISQIVAKQVEVAGVTTDGLAAYTRRSHAGEVTAAAIVHGSRLTAEGVSIHLDRTATLVVHWTANRVTGHVAADGFPDAGVTLAVSGLRTVVSATLNDKPLTLDQGTLVIPEPGDFELRFVGAR